MLCHHAEGQLNQRLFCGSQEFVSPYQILILKFLGLFSISYVRMRHYECTNHTGRQSEEHQTSSISSYMQITIFVKDLYFCRNFFCQRSDGVINLILCNTERFCSLRCRPCYRFKIGLSNPFKQSHLKFSEFGHVYPNPFKHIKTTIKIVLPFFDNILLL